MFQCAKVGTIYHLTSVTGRLAYRYARYYHKTWQTLCLFVFVAAGAGLLSEVRQLANHEPSHRAQTARKYLRREAQGIARPATRPQVSTCLALRSLACADDSSTLPPSRFTLLEVDEAADPAASIARWKAGRVAAAAKSMLAAATPCRIDFDVPVRHDSKIFANNCCKPFSRRK